MRPARECLTHTLQCGRETKCAHRGRAVGSGSRVCDVQEGLERMGQSCHSFGVGVARAWTRPPVTAQRHRPLKISVRHMPTHLRYNCTQHTQALHSDTPQECLTRVVCSRFSDNREWLQQGKEGFPPTIFVGLRYVAFADALRSFFSQEHFVHHDCVVFEWWYWTGFGRRWYGDSWCYDCAIVFILSFISVHTSRSDALIFVPFDCSQGSTALLLR